MCVKIGAFLFRRGYFCFSVKQIMIQIAEKSHYSAMLEKNQNTCEKQFSENNIAFQKTYPVPVAPNFSCVF